MKPRQWGAASLAAATSVVSGLTALERTGVVPLRDVASSPDSAAQGKVWLLVTNGLVADNPVVASLLALLLLGAAAIVLCGPRLAWTVALVGHVGATAAVYLLLALARLVVPGTFEGILEHPDYGVSAILAAWLGAGSAIMWRRHPAARTRMGVVALCLAAAALGWTLDTSRTALDLDHVLAFGIGIGLAANVAWARTWVAVRARLAALARPARSTPPARSTTRW